MFKSGDFYFSRNREGVAGENWRFDRWSAICVLERNLCECIGKMKMWVVEKLFGTFLGFG